MLRLASLLSLLLLLVSMVSAQSEVLNHYGVMTLAAPSVEQELLARFKGTGKPMFLVHDVRVGVSAGDIIRFADKAVLIDASVMQTLQATGALKMLKQAPILRLQAKSQSSVWQGRSTLVQNSREQKAYRLGGEVLKVFEDYFGKAPASEEIVLRFVGKDLEMLVPDVLMDRLTFASVRKVVAGGRPVLITEAPSSHLFRTQSFTWRVWGADPVNPEAELRYGIIGELPSGIEWNDSLHGLQGTLDSAGTFPLVAWVRNPSGASDSLHFSLTIQDNAVPHILPDLPPMVVPDEPYLWTLPVQDADHALSLLRCLALQAPTGIVVDSLCNVTGRVAADWSGPDTLKVLVRDPLGAEDSTAFELGLQPAATSPLRAIKFLLPKDSLVASRMYVWAASKLVVPGVEILSVKGPEGVTFVHGAEDSDSLYVKISRSGMHSLVFRITAGDDTVELVQRIVVLANRAPVILSALSAHLVREGTGLNYKPVAVDPDGDFIRYTARNLDGSPLVWKGYEIPLWTQSPGSYAMEVQATDGINPPVFQRVTWSVEPESKEWLGLTGRYQQVDDENYFWLGYRKGSGRFGLFTPKLSKVIASESVTTKEWPFVYVGGSLLGEKGLAHGNWLYTDMGLQIRNPGNKLITGGVMLGVDGHWTSPSRVNPWVFELEFTAHSSQAILLVDTTGWNQTDLVLTFNNGQKNLNMSNLNTDSLLGELFGPAYSKILSDASDRHNTVFRTRLEGFVPIAHSETFGQLLAGVVTWREDYLNGLDLSQWFGLSIRHQVELPYFNLTQTLRWGIFSGGGPAGVIRYDLTTNLGTWR